MPAASMEVFQSFSMFLIKVEGENSRLMLWTLKQLSWFSGAFIKKYSVFLSLFIVRGIWEVKLPFVCMLVFCIKAEKEKGYKKSG